MDATFLDAFYASLDRLSGDPYDWLRPLVQEVVEDVVKPQDLSVRADGMYFLLINLGSMIIAPWQEATSTKFPDVPHNQSMLREDLRNILTIATISTRTKQRSEISANALFQATAFFDQGLTVRALKMWNNENEQ